MSWNRQCCPKLHQQFVVLISRQREFHSLCDPGSNSAVFRGRIHIMKQLLRTALVLAFAFSAGIGHAADDKVLLTYKSLTGQVARYKSEGTLHLDVAGMKVNLEMKEVEKVT